MPSELSTTVGGRCSTPSLVGVGQNNWSSLIVESVKFSSKKQEKIIQGTLIVSDQEQTL